MRQTPTAALPHGLGRSIDRFEQTLNCCCRRLDSSEPPTIHPSTPHTCRTTSHCFRVAGSFGAAAPAFPLPSFPSCFFRMRRASESRELPCGVVAVVVELCEKEGKGEI